MATDIPLTELVRQLREGDWADEGAPMDADALWAELRERGYDPLSEAPAVSGDVYVT